jgi:hypothetical protein
MEAKPSAEHTFIIASAERGLDTEDKKTVLSLMDAYIAKTKIQTLLHAK